MPLMDDVIIIIARTKFYPAKSYTGPIPCHAEEPKRFFSVRSNLEVPVTNLKVTLKAEET
jgi:hypothetical protein